MVQKMLGIREAKNGAKTGECCRLEQMGNKEFGKMMNTIQTLEEGRVPVNQPKNWRTEGEKKRITRTEYHRLSDKFEMEGLMAQEACGTWQS